MAFEIKTEIIIQASSSLVWEVFTDFKNYYSWNPFIQSLEGEVALQKKIKVQICPPGSNAMTFKPIVVGFEKEKLFSWQGHLLIPGIFDGKHIYIIEDLGNNTVRFIQGESFKGILLPFFKKMLLTNTLQGFQDMNEALKIEVMRRKMGG